MPKPRSLDEFIAKKAAEFADHVKGAAALADTEEEIRIDVENQLAFIKKEVGIDFEKVQGKHEFTVAKGRIDSVYSRVIIEYKNPSDAGACIGAKLDAPGTKKVVEQIKSRFRSLHDEHGHLLNSLFGVGLDGQRFVFVRFRDNKWDLQEPVDVSKHSAERFLWALYNLGQAGCSESPSVAKPFLRWAGSKRKQLARLKEFWGPQHQRYIEPFAGSACLFFELGPQKAVLGDNNAALMEVYRVVRENPERLYARLSHIPRDEQDYYRWRRMPPERLDRETRALRFLYLNRNCFNGIYRTNQAGGFNVPFGRPPIAYLSKSELMLCSARLAAAKLVACDFGKSLALARRGDFVYMDPPFAVKSRRVFREYGQTPFETKDVMRLGEELGRLDRIGVDFLVSYADCTQARALAREWNSVRFAIRRNVAGFVDRRRQAYEWFISNLPIPDAVRSPGSSS